MKLSPAQQHAKDQVRRTRAAQKTARATFDAEMEIAWTARSAKVTEDLHTAVREAVRLKVPTKQIGEAYGSKDWATVRRLVDAVTAEQNHIVETMLHVDVISSERFILTLSAFDDWTDPSNGTEPLTGEAVYIKQDGEWMPESFDDVSRAVERELWINTPLRQEVTKYVDLDSLVDVEDDSDYEADEVWTDARGVHLA